MIGFVKIKTFGKYLSKTVLFAPFTILVLFTFFTCSKQQVRPRTDFSSTRHIGKWRGSDTSGRIGRLFLFSNGFAYFSAGGQSFGGPRLSKRGGLLYEIDHSKSPISLDFIGISHSYKELRRIRAIIKFLGPKQMKVCTFMNDVRPKNFRGKNGCHKILLKKMINQ